LFTQRAVGQSSAYEAAEFVALARLLRYVKHILAQYMQAAVMLKQIENYDVAIGAHGSISCE